MSFAKVLCATDFSEPAHHAMELALRVAAPGAVVTLLHVVQVPPVPYVEYAVSTAQVMQELERSARAGLDRWQAEARGKRRDLHVEAIHLVGVPWQRIVEVARTQAQDVIVLGTHGRTGLKHALVGSVAERVVRLAPCPVLVTHGETP